VDGSGYLRDTEKLPRELEDLEEGLLQWSGNKVSNRLPLKSGLCLRLFQWCSPRHCDTWHTP